VYSFVLGSAPTVSLQNRRYARVTLRCHLDRSGPVRESRVPVRPAPEAMVQSEAVPHALPAGSVILAVDGNSLVHRAYHAAAGSAATTAAGEPMWAVRGLIGQVVAGVERVGADVVVVGFDDPTASLRREQWPQYKQQRVDKAQCLVDQLALAADTLRAMGIAVCVPPGLEADDVLASTAAYARSAGARTVIMTSDRDSFALIDDTTSVLRILNGGVEASPLLTPARLPLLLGIRGDQYRDFAALRGDPSDNLPGVRGIGPKTAAKLLVALDTAQAAFDDLAAGGTRVAAAIGKGAARRLAAPEARAAWELNCAVMAMRPDVDLGLPGDAAGSGAGHGRLPLDPEAVRQAYRRVGLIYSLGTALRVLARAEGEIPAPRPPDVHDEPAPHWYARPQRFPRLAARPAEPAVVQLSLFA
jgi:DNA polymerase-1